MTCLLDDSSSRDGRPILVCEGPLHPTAAGIQPYLGTEEADAQPLQDYRGSVAQPAYPRPVSNKQGMTMQVMWPASGLRVPHICVS